MTDRLLLGSAAALWVGLTLLLGELRWFGRPSLRHRLRPFLPGRTPARPHPARTFADVLGPLAAAVGGAAGRVLGHGDDVSQRLARIHSNLTSAAFRVRQLAWAVTALLAAVAAATGLQLPAAPAVALVVASAIAAYALSEYQLAGHCRRWDERRELELPVVAEQLAMLVSAGYSLGSSLNRVADRSHGVVSRDLSVVCVRIRHGLTERQALREWAALVRSPAVDRLVSVLDLSADTTDVGRLLSDEARALRRRVQRSALEVMDRRAQQVWVPVTVAALVPGVVLLAVPFAHALRLITGS